MEERKQIENKEIAYCDTWIPHVRGKRLIGVMSLFPVVKGVQCNIFCLVVLALK